MAKETIFDHLDDVALNDLIDEAVDLHILAKKAEAKYRPIANHIKAEMLRRELEEWETPAGTPAKIVRIPKDFPNLEAMRAKLPEGLYYECVRSDVQVNLIIGKRQA